MKRLTILAILFLGVVAGSPAQDTAPGTLWVHQGTGVDTNPGTREQPLATIPAAIKRLKPGTTLHVLPGDQPYPGDIRIEVSGTAEAPIVIDGHGSRVCGMRRLPAAEWQALGDDTFSRPLRNNAWGMETHWEGGFELVRFDGQPGRNVTARDQLAPLVYFLYKNRKAGKDDPLHNTLFIRLPAGKTPDDLVVEAIADGGGIYVAGSHVTVRNFVCEYGGTDGFSTHRNKEVVFENIEARYYMDQGMSHHGAEVVVRNAHFHHNAGGGIVDVYPEVKVRYENCLIEDDTWRGGVELYSGEFELRDCVIKGNAGKAMTVTRGARVVLRNCLLISPAPSTTMGINFDGDQASLTMENCTLVGFATGLGGRLLTAGRATVRRCAFVNCTANVRLHCYQGKGQEPVDPAACLTFAENHYTPALWEVPYLLQHETGWKVDKHAFGPTEHAGFAERIGGDPGSVVQELPLAADPTALPPFATANGEPIGARLKLPLTVGPKSNK